MAEARANAGRFAAGNPGKPTGARHRATRAVEQMLDGEHRDLTKVVIERALGGDMAAMRLCLERLAPPVRDAPINVELAAVRTAGDSVAASAALFAAAAAGEITPDEARRMMLLLVQHKGIIETADLERRIVALEKGLKG